MLILIFLAFSFIRLNGNKAGAIFNQSPLHSGIKQLIKSWIPIFMMNLPLMFQFKRSQGLGDMVLDNAALSIHSRSHNLDTIACIRTFIWSGTSCQHSQFPKLWQPARSQWAFWRVQGSVKCELYNIYNRLPYMGSNRTYHFLSSSLSWWCLCW